MPGTNEMIGQRFKEGMEIAQERLVGLEGDAQRLVKNLLVRGRASRKEVSTFLQRLRAGEVIDGGKVRGWSSRARGVRDDLGRRVGDVKQRLVGLTGMATRERLDEVARELDKLSRRVERSLNGKKKPQKH